MVSLVSCRCVVCLYFLVLWLFLFCCSALESSLKKKRGSILFLLTSAAHKISFLLLLFLLTLLLATERVIIKIPIKNRYEMTLDGDVSLDGLAVGLRYSNSAVFEYLGIFEPSFSPSLSSLLCIALVEVRLWCSFLLLASSNLALSYEQWRRRRRRWRLQWPPMMEIQEELEVAARFACDEYAVQIPSFASLSLFSICPHTQIHSRNRPEA